MNTITIGRNPANTIAVGAQYVTVSGQHATISQANGQLYLQDHSTNGSYVNGQHIHNQQIAISSNDTITLGREYRLDMSAVLRALQGAAGGQATSLHRQPVRPVVVNIQNNIEKPAHKDEWEYSDAEEAKPSRTAPKNLNSFNWGAFWLNWIWSVANGVWWGLLCFIPFVNIVVMFVLGFKGNRSAWEKFSGSAEEFEKKQSSWAMWGWIIFVISLIANIIAAFANA